MLERPLPNACDAVGDRNACKAAATVERPISNACDGKPFMDGRDIHFRCRARITGHRILGAVVGKFEYKSFRRFMFTTRRADAVHIVVCNRRDGFRIAVAAGAGVSHNAFLRASWLPGDSRSICMLMRRHGFVLHGWRHGFVLHGWRHGFVLHGRRHGFVVGVARSVDGRIAAVAAAVPGIAAEQIACRKGKRAGERHTSRQQHDNQFLFHFLPPKFAQGVKKACSDQALHLRFVVTQTLK